MVKIIIVEGLIGGGKSTLINTVINNSKYNIVGVTEQVDDWQSCGILSRFYGDKKRWSYSFQTHVYISRCINIRNTIINKMSGGENVDAFIFERSPVSDRIFMMANEQHIDDCERYMYDKLCSTMDLLLPFNMSDANVIYLDIPIDTCMERIASRGREEEIGITAQYQENLKRAHEIVFSDPACPYKKINKLNIGDFRNTDSEAFQELMNAINSIIES